MWLFKEHVFGEKCIYYHFVNKKGVKSSLINVSVVIYLLPKLKETLSKYTISKVNVIIVAFFVSNQNGIYIVLSLIRVNTSFILNFIKRVSRDSTIPIHYKKN